jgi:hypothetical protein
LFAVAPDEELPGRQENRRAARVDRRRERHDGDFRGHRLGALAGQLADLLNYQAVRIFGGCRRQQQHPSTNAHRSLGSTDTMTVFRPFFARALFIDPKSLISAWPRMGCDLFSSERG